MCLAEALLRVPDNETRDALIARQAFGLRLGRSTWAPSKSTFVNAATFSLMLTGEVLRGGKRQRGDLASPSALKPRHRAAG